VKGISLNGVQRGRAIPTAPKVGDVYSIPGPMPCMPVNLFGVLGPRTDTIKQGVVEPPSGALLSRTGKVVKVAEEGGVTQRLCSGRSERGVQRRKRSDGPRGGEAKRPEQGGGSVN